MVLFYSPFFITNPTEMSYEFQWTCLDAPSSSPLTTPTFKCLTPKGQVTGGKKFQVKLHVHSVHVHVHVLLIVTTVVGNLTILVNSYIK